LRERTINAWAFMNRIGVIWRGVLAAVLLLGGVWGCKEKPDPEVPFDYEDGILVVNEGNFQGGNASLDFLRRSDDSLRKDVFLVENERPLGDVAQSVTVIGSKAYIVVNNSGKIEVVDLPSLQSHCTITGLRSPRYLLDIGGGRALVTDLYADSISVVNLGTCAVEGRIAVGAWTEEMLRIGNRVIVAEMGTDQLLVIDVASRTLVDSVFVGREPNSMVIDQNGRLWVLCGNALGQAVPQLVQMNVDSMTIEAVFPFASGQEAPTRLCINAAGDQLYFLNGGIYKMGIGDGNLPSQAWVAKGGHTWYGLEIDPVAGWLYATDALDYQREGKVYRFSLATAQELASFEAGIIPGELVFLP
jgi:hypothetical protein